MSKVKICGLSRPEDIDIVNRALPDFIGLVFASSHRRVDMKTAALLKKKLDPRIKAVGVFVNEDMDKIISLYEEEVIDIVQLHGDEDSGYIKQLKASCGCTVIKSVSVGDILPAIPVFPDYLLFDTLSDQRGGTGRQFDWNLLKEYVGPQYFLAGGLTVDNVSDAVNTLSPYCVDVSGGVETGGIKDEKKIIDFVKLVRRNSK